MKLIVDKAEPGGVIEHRNVELTILVPTTGTASNGAVLDRVIRIVSEAMHIYNAEWSLEHATVRKAQ